MSDTANYPHILIIIPIILIIIRTNIQRTWGSYVPHSCFNMVEYHFTFYTCVYSLVLKYSYL